MRYLEGRSVAIMERADLCARTPPDSVTWVFFALGAKPTSMRRAIAERLAEDNFVVIVDHKVSVLRDRAIPSFQQRRIPLGNSGKFWHYRPLHFPEQVPGLGRAFRLFNQRLLQRELNHLTPRGMPRIVCYDSPSQCELVRLLRGDLSIYLAIDDRTLTVAGVPIKGELEAEKKLLERVNKVICVSEPLAETLRSRMASYPSKPVHVLRNGYDEHVFNHKRNYPEPAALKGVPKPRVLVAGHISDRIDWDGIRRASLLRPDWTWIFLGPADPGKVEQILHDLSGRGLWYPQAELADVPAWISHSDACAVPYRLNAFTFASYPLKAIEYLAMGVPVLSTRVPALQHYGDVVLWVNEGDAEAYAEALDRCLTLEAVSSRYEARRRAVKEDPWGVRVNQFRRMVFNGNS
jgi:glycosyltransferase involved in cell wall biosynthesis